MLVMHCTAHAAASLTGDIVAAKSPEDYAEVPLSNLCLDRQNPRLRGDREWKSITDEELLAEFARSYRLIEIAHSIVDKGFTPRYAEALLVIAHPSQANAYVVIEGNRRLATLKLLTSKSARAAAGVTGEWDDLAKKAAKHQLHEAVPVIVYPCREALNDYLGFRHITGPRPWRPEAKARFIGKLLSDGESIDSVVRRIGSNHRTVRRFAEAHAIFTQARDAGLPVDEVEKGFGVFYNALDQEGVRQYLGLVSPQGKIDTLPDSPITQQHLDNLKTLIELLFGDQDNGLDRVIAESRELRRLGKVLAHSRARVHLVQNRDLHRAWRIAGGGKEEVLSTLSGIHSQLAEVSGKSTEFGDDEEVRHEVNLIYRLVLDMAVRYKVQDD